MTSLHRWACADGKRPVRVSGRAASSTNPLTWTDYASVVGRAHGIMLGDGLACYDLDDVIADDGSLHTEAAELLDSIADPIWVERSMSGRGLHVFVHGDGPSHQGERVSFYTWGRFIVVTGNHYQHRSRLTTNAR